VRSWAPLLGCFFIRELALVWHHPPPCPPHRGGGSSPGRPAVQNDETAWLAATLPQLTVSRRPEPADKYSEFTGKPTFRLNFFLRFIQRPLCSFLAPRAMIGGERNSTQRFWYHYSRSRHSGTGISPPQRHVTGSGAPNFEHGALQLGLPKSGIMGRVPVALRLTWQMPAAHCRCGAKTILNRFSA
jgi:hypothetical protein